MTKNALSFFCFSHWVFRLLEFAWNIGNWNLEIVICNLGFLSKCLYFPPLRRVAAEATISLYFYFIIPYFFSILKRPLVK